MGRRILRGVRSLLDLALPAVCGGCGTPLPPPSGGALCRECRDVLRDVPARVSPRVDPGVPVWALGRYRGVHRGVVVAAKEHGRRDLAAPLGAALARALLDLYGWGELDPSAPVCLVPAPTRAAAARRRGGDPVTAAAVAAVGGDRVCRALRTSFAARDSVGLSPAARRANLERWVRVDRRALRSRAPGSVVLVDDVLTTGATAAVSVRRLAAAGVGVAAILVVAAV
ncbi:ComF family protein [Rhodococcus rhodnii]|uniref:ComF family protein n=1 Tax=Rhodococcus rhodnii TaxID=38312 RepID=A0A6P2CJR4_9NOCA|nr:ComF family protein [Rhodococcus rhodnii]